MKKILTFILVFALCLGALCSCGADVAEVAGTYKIEKNIYYATLVDKAYNTTDGYSIEQKDGKTVLFVSHVGISGEDIKSEAGELKAFSLSKSNFDDIIFGEAWDEGATESGLRKNNKAAWETSNKTGENFYVMLQKDGSVLISCIKSKEGVKSCAYIRKIVK
jgi:hypothetical protein